MIDDRGVNEKHDMPPASWIDDVVAFWFGQLRPKDWWRASPALDALVLERFGGLLAEFTRAPPSAATLDAVGHVAAAIVFDQFSRHIFRGAGQAFATDPFALLLAVDAIDRGLDAALPQVQRHFLYMPLMHSEDLAMQSLSIEMFGRLDDPRALRSARAHRDTLARFGRFPYRNASLGRESTPEETAFLAGRQAAD